MRTTNKRTGIRLNAYIERTMLVRAGYACEYCRQRLLDTTWEVEHIWPRSRGGSSNLENIAVACSRCNNNKGNHVEWIDRLTGRSCALFNPRIMVWNEHFEFGRGEIRGRTGIGRATVALLLRSTPQYLPKDLCWNKIEGLQKNESLYYFMNHLRFKRLRNDFSSLYQQLIAPFPQIDATHQEYQLARFARDMLLLELFFTRSKRQDLTMGISHGEELLKSGFLDESQRKDILGVLSILYQQRATVHFRHGRRKDAVSDQSVAANLYNTANHLEDSIQLKLDDPNKIVRFLRATSMKGKYDQLDVGVNVIDACLERIADFDPFYVTAHYAYLVDLVLLSSEPQVRRVERLYEVISGVLHTEGYGTTTDHARLITLRRRWWVLHFILEMEPDWEAFASDLMFWREVSMFNEIRELDAYILKVNLPHDRVQEIHRAIKMMGGS